VVPGDGITEVRSPGVDGDEIRPIEGWLDVFNALYAFRGREVRVVFEGGKELPVEALTPELFDPSAYAVAFVLPPLEPLMGPEIQTNNPLAAVAWGAGETGHFIMMTYGTLRSWIQGTISHKEFTGPVGIGGLAIQVGRKSVIELVYLMAIISVSLAVINFLPLPVVDGGHAVFLIIEKIRGKPVPTKIVNVVQMVGLALLLFVFVWLTWNDITNLMN
jgi:regulator of sigma E protease